jgi:hypothetical protein
VIPDRTAKARPVEQRETPVLCPTCLSAMTWTLSGICEYCVPLPSS